LERASILVRLVPASVAVARNSEDAEADVPVSVILRERVAGVATQPGLG
jgi:uncharacterized lipoprotein YbaY